MQLNKICNEIRKIYIRTVLKDYTTSITIQEGWKRNLRESEKSTIGIRDGLKYIDSNRHIEDTRNHRLKITKRKEIAKEASSRKTKLTAL